jgi:ABC-type amino acid transport system, permease component
MHHFDWSGIPGALPTLWTGAIVTIKITLIAIVIGIVWGTFSRSCGCRHSSRSNGSRRPRSRCSVRSRW